MCLIDDDDFIKVSGERLRVVVRVLEGGLGLNWTKMQTRNFLLGCSVGPMAEPNQI